MDMDMEMDMNMEIEKIKVLGSGCFGVVHLVKRRCRYYAIKSAEYIKSDSLQVERLTLRDFTGCPNIIQCFDGFVSYEEDRGGFYNIVLEYASGGDLMDFITKKYGGKVPEKEVKRYVRMIAEGLVEVHKRGYVHSDLKPENIFVFTNVGAVGCPVNYTLKIGDFGLAKEIGDSKQVWRNGFHGTPQFMSPESVVGEISGALDIWSLGCITVQMITGKPAWGENINIGDLSEMLLKGCAPEIPKTMSCLGKDFLEMCFVINPKKRWTATMLLDHPFLQPDSLHPPPQQSPQRFPIYELFPTDNRRSLLTI